ncbi:MAG: hypothetical protein LBF37_02175 [Rickettsiales bacterium]|jgi:hypothetical protein|nr:hypothetical protein [Rickettsiales bacterium]
MENTEKNEAIETVAEKPAAKTVSVDLTAEQYAFLTKQQKTHEKELGIEVPIGALVRKAIETAMNADARPSRDAAKSFGDRKPGSGRPPRDGGADRGPSRFGDRKPSFGDRGAPRGRPAGRLSMGRGPKFDMLSKGKPRRFDDK